MPDDDLDLAEALDRTVADLINLGLLAKHAHWNVAGPGFGSLHVLLDEVAAVARRAGDDIAERSVALGRHPDGRPATVWTRNVLPSVEPGPLRDIDAMAAFGGILEIVSTRLFSSISATSCDLVTQTLLIDVARHLDRLAWMMRAHGESD